MIRLIIVLSVIILFNATIPVRAMTWVDAGVLLGIGIVAEVVGIVITHDGN